MKKKIENKNHTEVMNKIFRLLDAVYEEIKEEGRREAIEEFEIMLQEKKEKKEEKPKKYTGMEIFAMMAQKKNGGTLNQE